MIPQKSVQCGLSDFSRGFAVKCFGPDSWQIFTSFVENFQINSEKIHIQAVEKHVLKSYKKKNHVKTSSVNYT
jgi:hypothetical protein